MIENNNDEEREGRDRRQPGSEEEGTQEENIQKPYGREVEEIRGHYEDGRSKEKQMTKE